jgi:hypothetical protein
MPGLQRILDWTALVGFIALWTTATLGAFRQFSLDGSFGWACGWSFFAALCAYLLADLLAGLTHWIADRLFEPSTPWIGPLLIVPFREHHADPGAIARHDLATVLGNSALTTLPLAASLLLLPPSTTAARLALTVFAHTLVLALFLTNLFHRWAHSPRRARAVRWLQSAGLVLTPSHHALHHRGDHDSAYCVTTGWLNPILDRLGFFPRLERRMRMLVPESGEHRN